MDKEKTTEKEEILGEENEEKELETVKETSYENKILDLETQTEEKVVVNPRKQDNQSKKAKRNKIIKTVLLLLFFGATFYAVYAVSKTLSGGNIASLNEVLSTVSPLFACVLVLVVILLFLTDAIKYSIVSKITMKKFDYKLNIGVGIMGRFYDNITPFNTGGQAYQVYQYYKAGYPSSIATVIPIVKYVFQLVAWIVVSLVLYIANHSVLGYLPDAQAAAVGSLTYLGIAVAACAPILVILFSIFPNAVHKVIAFFIKLGCKLKIVKDFDKVDKQVIDFLESYRQAFLYITKDFWGVASLIIVSMLDFIIMMSLPFFVIVALGKTEPTMELFWNMVTLNAYSLFAASLVPTPGNSGAIEGVASMAFAPFPMGEGSLFWIVFIWRICSYYIYIILGLLATFAKFIKNFVAKRKKVKNA